VEKNEKHEDLINLWIKIKQNTIETKIKILYFIRRVNI
jgi:hypothetical protein